MRRKIIVFIVIFIIIFIACICCLPIKNTKIYAKMYLNNKYKDDSFSNINFCENGEYIVRKAHWWGDGETSLNNDGTYTRYKVHSNKENIDFYVQ